MTGQIILLVANKRSLLNRSLSGLSFGQDENGNWGYRIAGADSVIPFSDNVDIKCGIKVRAIDNAGGTAFINGQEIIFTINKRGKQITSNFPSSASNSSMTVIGSANSVTMSSCRVYLYGFRLISITNV